MYVQHHLIKKDSIESRRYQEAILSTCLNSNTLVVLPTGLGKTPIAVLLAAHRLEKFPESKILVLAPTKPLANQHLKSFKNFFELPEEKFEVITGEMKPEKRGQIYKQKVLLFATPQTIRNDLENGTLNLKDFSLLVVDEIHHSVGGYAYPFVAQKYLEEAENKRILGLTASPGGTREKIKEICKNTGIEKVEIRTENSEDVLPYIKEKTVEWLKVDLPESFQSLRDIINKTYKSKVDGLRKMHLVYGRTISKKQLLAAQMELVKSMKAGNQGAIISMSIVGQAIRLEHALTLLETQGISILDKYWEKLRLEKKAGRLLEMKDVSNAVYLTRQLKERGYRHPKMGKICSIVDQQLKANPDSKVIIFANYRETVKEIVDVLKNVEGAKPVQLVGQKEGLTQKEQTEVLRNFSEGVYNVLIGTSISEEGIHVSGADLAIFYEAVPSEIRNIQRRGRVGRTNVSKIIILITRNSRDEAYYWSSQKKEKAMKGILHGMKEETTLGDFK